MSGVLGAVLDFWPTLLVLAVILGGPWLLEATGLVQTSTAAGSMTPGTWILSIWAGLAPYLAVAVVAARVLIYLVRGG